MPPPRLVIFDVDGTLVDSQHAILAAMARAFAAAGRPMPAREAALGIVGLSLPEAFAALVPDASQDEQTLLAALYKDAFVAMRREGRAEAAAPLYPGARSAVERLAGGGHVLSIATGKARRGLDHTLAAHDIGHHFVATQTADDAPSKPHPDMVLRCLDGTGVPASRAVVVGDTAFDMEMARSAGVSAIGVGWGYHDSARLLAAGAHCVLGRFEELDRALSALWEAA